jgi:hypothetical protein
MPAADAAVRIAKVLGVTVEYLIMGHERQEQKASPLLPNSRAVLKKLESLSKRDQKIVFNLINSLREIEESEKKNKMVIPEYLTPLTIQGA